MEVGDLVREKALPCAALYGRVLQTGIIVRVDWSRATGQIVHPYLVAFSNGEVDWMREGFLEVINGK